MATRGCGVIALVLSLASGCEALTVSGGAASRRCFAQAAGVLACTQTLPALAADEAKVVKKFEKTEGGVVYFDLKQGTGYYPNPGDFLVITYKGYLSNGKLFDSSDAPGKGPKAAKYMASPPQLLKGWEEALETMREGGTRVIQVPAALAYGKEGVCDEKGCLVPPDEKLQFELTLKRVALPPP